MKINQQQERLYIFTTMQKILPVFNSIKSFIKRSCLSDIYKESFSFWLNKRHYYAKGVNICEPPTLPAFERWDYVDNESLQESLKDESLKAFA